jgi:hypothetical protein
MLSQGSQLAAGQQEGQAVPAQQQGAPGPFVVTQQAPQVVLTAGGQPLLPLGGSGGSGLPLAGSGSSINAAFLQQYYATLGGSVFSGLQLPGSGGSGIPLGGSGGSGIPLAGGGGSGLPLAGAFSLQEQQIALGAGAWPENGGATGFASSLSLPILPAGGGYSTGPAAMQQGPATTATAATKGPKARKARPYVRPDQVQAEKKKKADVQAYCRQLEQQLGRARAELEKLQQVQALCGQRDSGCTCGSSWHQPLHLTPSCPLHVAVATSTDSTAAPPTDSLYPLLATACLALVRRTRRCRPRQWCSFSCCAV